MDYQEIVSQRCPALVLIAIDQTGHMAEPVQPGDQRTRAEVAASAANQLIAELAIRCVKGIQDIRDYFYLSVIGQHSGQVSDLLSGSDDASTITPSPISK